MQSEMCAATRRGIRHALGAFANESLREAAEDLLRCLAYESDRYEDEFDFGPLEFLDWADDAAPDRRIATRSRELIRRRWKRIRVVFQYTDDELTLRADCSDDQRRSADMSRIKSFLFVTVDLASGEYSRNKLAAMTRAINRPLAMPAIVFFRYRRADQSVAVTLAVIHRRAHKRDAERDVLDRATLIKDIRVAKPHRAHIDILSDLAIPQLPLTSRTFDGLHRAWEKVLDTEALNRRFYNGLFEWFQLAVRACSFPDDGAGPGNGERHVIRMITRLLFIWFLKERELVPGGIFEERFANEQLKHHAADRSDYYRAVLQNLFFATLNTPIDQREFSTQSRTTHRVFTRYRYERLLQDPPAFMRVLKTIPFVNGGLFDCLDTFEHRGGGGRRIDAFTDNVSQGRALHVPARLFFDQQSGLFPLLRRYKFTVEENTPLDQEVALDPELLGNTFENLLAAYNPETREPARKATGSYYTPREVVDYMVREALVAYLAKVVPPYDGDRTQLEWRLRHLLSIDQGEGTSVEQVGRDGPHRGDDHFMKPTEIDALIVAIHEMRILDPACGSGAFPMSILHKLVVVLGKIDPRNQRWKERQLQAATDIPDPSIREKYKQTVEAAFSRSRAYGDFGRKLYLIQRVIHGVDIQPIATAIARLRFFISLIIEQPTDETEENAGLEPLPNLETSFVSADALHRLRPCSAQEAFRSSEVDALVDELTKARRAWFDAHDRDTKWEIKKRDAQLRMRLRDALMKDEWDRSTAERLAAWDVYDQNASAKWFDPEWMFGRECFHIVIGNPPYIQLQRDGGQLRRKYADEGYRVFAATGDVYTLFMERGCQLLQPGNGVLAYITSNSWLRAGYGSRLRSHLASRQTPLSLVEMGKDVFSSAIVDSAVLVMRQGGGRTRHFRAVDMDRTSTKQLPPPKDEWCEARPTGSAPWSIMSRREWGIMDKMRTRGVPLKDWDGISIYMGIKTGYNQAFIVDGKRRSDLVAEDARSADLLVPVLRGRDIERYRARWADRWLIATLPSLNVDIDQYPAIKRHLMSFGKDKLAQAGAILADGSKSRKKTRHRWFEMQDTCAYHEHFAKPKIAWIELANRPRFAYDESGVYVEATVFMATGPSVKYLCAVLNSRLAHWYIRKTAPTSGMGTLRWKKAYVTTMPVPALTLSEQMPFRHLVDSLAKRPTAASNTDRADAEDRIDDLLGRTYGLTSRDMLAVRDPL